MSGGYGGPAYGGPGMFGSPYAGAGAPPPMYGSPYAPQPGGHPGYGTAAAPPPGYGVAAARRKVTLRTWLQGPQHAPPACRGRSTPPPADWGRQGLARLGPGRSANLTGGCGHGAGPVVAALWWQPCGGSPVVAALWW